MTWKFPSSDESTVSTTYAVSSLCHSVWEAADLNGHQCSACDQSPALGSEVEHRVVSSAPNNKRSKPPVCSLPNLMEKAVEHPRSLDVRMKAASLGLSCWDGHGTATGRLMNGRNMKSPCSQNCSRCDSPKLSEDERRKIFDNFWSLSIHERQWLFLLGSVKTQPLKKKCAAPGSKREKKMNRAYHFLINGSRKRVCKTMFKNTLCISDSWINSALSHFSESGLIPDMRGRHLRKRSWQN